VSPAIIAAMVFQDEFMEMIGKDPSLTGRTEIWAWAIFNIHLKPLLGWGYLAFWTRQNPAAMQIADALHWEAPQAHNGLLEMLLFVGLVGTSYIVFLWGRALWLALRCLRTPEQEIGVTCLLSCVGLVLVGISETVLVDPYEASTDVFFITALFCERALRAAHAQRVAGFRPVRVTSTA
jgi:O-antigen ligase